MRSPRATATPRVAQQQAVCHGHDLLRLRDLGCPSSDGTVKPAVAAMGGHFVHSAVTAGPALHVQKRGAGFPPVRISSLDEMRARVTPVAFCSWRLVEACKTNLRADARVMGARNDLSWAGDHPDNDAWPVLLGRVGKGEERLPRWLISYIYIYIYIYRCIEECL
jgi:hypothetical protein